jgi:hypothetical protein
VTPVSVAAACIVLGSLVVLMVKTKAVKFWGAVLCTVFGITLAASPIGPTIGGLLSDAGLWAYEQLRNV